MLKKLALAYGLFCCAAFAFYGLPSQANDEAAAPSSSEARAKQAIQAFSKALKAELMAAMKEGGPKAAVSVCNEQAPAIAAAVGADENLTIGRTSLKVRNPNNAPTDWQRATLEEFEARKAAGEEIATLEESFQRDGSYYFMKAIPIKGLCLTCHGAKLPKSLEDHIHSYYPDDQATGFKPGDIRGAFIVKIAAE